MGLLVALAGDSRWTRVSEVIGRHEEAAAEASVPMPGLTEALAETAEATTAVVTMLPEAVARTVLGRHRVEVDVLVGRQPELASTPAPDQLLAAAWMLEVDPASAVVIGDSTWDAMAAAAAGCRFVGVTNGGRSKFPQGTPTAPTLPEAIRLV